MVAHASGIAVEPLYPVDAYTSLLVHVYQMISPRDLERLTWMRRSVPYSLREFLNYLHEQPCVFQIRDGDELAGMFWIFDIVSGESCEIAGWMPFSYRGEGSHQATAFAIEYLHDKLNFRRVWARTVYLAARAHCRRAGMREIAAIPGVHNGKRSGTLYVLCNDV